MKFRTGRLIVNSLVGAFVLLASFAAFLYRWTFSTWANLQIDELLYELSASLEGTSPELILDGVTSVFLPCAAAVLLYAVLLSVISRKMPKIRGLFLGLCLWGSVAALVILLSKAAQRLELAEHIRGAQTESTFIEDHYVSPADVKITFPEKKRNLIYIFLESMETTWMDKASGGAFKENIIKELTDIAATHEDFSGNSGEINGAHALTGTTWTMGAMFAHTAGLPLKISIEGSSMNTQKEFFPEIVNMGDILANAGYNQTLLIGSDANFGGRKMYFEDHGNFEIHDYAYAVEHGQIPADHFVWWGYEDFRLFEHAKQELLRLADQQEPFNLTMLTVDTHMDNGYVCEYCPEYPEEQYSKVYACSSRQIEAFINWIKQQDFYENTTIVLVGDHPTMSITYDDRIKGAERKVYLAYINSAAEYQRNEKRTCSTYDFFPTTMAAMGIDIEGEKLGLGVNLYSEEPTLIEKYGIDYINDETRKKSRFMERIAKIQKNIVKNAEVDISDGSHENEIKIQVLDLMGINEEIQTVELEISNTQGKVQRIPMEFQKDGRYEAYVDISEYDRDYGYLNIWVTDASGECHRVKQIEGNLRISACRSVEAYLDQLNKLDQSAIMIAALDDAQLSLSKEAQRKLKDLGLKTDWKDKFRHSYYAAILPNAVFENCAETPIEYHGELPDGKKYDLYSTAFLNENTGVDIIIDGQEYARELRGLNFAVYDCVLGKVVSTANYDTCLDAPSAKIKVKKSFFGRRKIEVSDVQVYNTVKEVYVRYWNEKDPRMVYQQDVVDGDVEGVYVGEVFLSGNGYLVAYGIDPQGNTYRLAETLL